MNFSSSIDTDDRSTRADMFTEILRLLVPSVIHGIGLGCLAVADRQYQRSQHDAAADMMTRHYRSKVDLLQERNNLVKLEEEARTLGIDLDQIEQEYRDTRDGLGCLDQTMARRRPLSHE